MLQNGVCIMSWKLLPFDIQIHTSIQNISGMQDLTAVSGRRQGAQAESLQVYPSGQIPADLAGSRIICPKVKQNFLFFALVYKK